MPLARGILREANRLNNHVLKVFTPITISITLVLALFAKPLYGLFSTDPQVIALGQKIMCIEVILEIGRCFNIVLVRDLQAVGDVRYPVTIGIISQWVVAVGGLAAGHEAGPRPGRHLDGLCHG